MRRPSRVVAAALGVLLTVAVSGHLIGVDANQVRHLAPSAEFRATVFHVTSCPKQPQGERFPGLDRLLELMDGNGLVFYQSSHLSPLAARDGIIAADDVVVIKINYQWAARGGTNIDLLRGLIRTIADLNILDCIWINANPVTGPATGYSGATRTDQLVASTDPVAADIWSVRNILVPAFEANGFTAPWPYPSADPDDPNSAFRRYLDNSMDALLAAGYQVTNREDAIDAIHADAGTSRPDGREATGRARPG